jgi:hypothetical protein
MTQATAEVDLGSLTGKRVNLTFRDKGEGEPQTLEGRVELANSLGVMFKEKGKSNVTLVEAVWIDNVEELQPKEPNVTVKVLQPIPLGRVRQHLADRHGYERARVNALTEAQAAAEHDAIDHENLAHRHEEPKAAQEAGASDEGAGDADAA